MVTIIDEEESQDLESFNVEQTSEQPQSTDGKHIEESSPDSQDFVSLAHPAPP